MNEPAQGQCVDKETIRQRLASIELKVRNEGLRARVDSSTDAKFNRLAATVMVELGKAGAFPLPPFAMVQTDVVMAAITAMVYHDLYPPENPLSPEFEPESVNRVVEAVMRLSLDSKSEKGTNTPPNDSKTSTSDPTRNMADKDHGNQNSVARTSGEHSGSTGGLFEGYLIFVLCGVLTALVTAILKAIFQSPSH